MKHCLLHPEQVLVSRVSIPFRSRRRACDRRKPVCNITEDRPFISKSLTLSVLNTIVCVLSSASIEDILREAASKIFVFTYPDVSTPAIERLAS